MRIAVILSIFFIFYNSHAEVSLSIGDGTFPLEFKEGHPPDSFQRFVAEDVSRVFSPLRHVTNVLDVAQCMLHPEQPHELTLREWYPDSFLGGWNVVNREGVIVFQMKSSLSRRYEEAYQGYGVVSNQFMELELLLHELNTGTITNGPDAMMESLVFLPIGSTLSASAESVREFLQVLSGMGPFSVSILDCWNEEVQGEICMVAAAKTAIFEAGEWIFVPVEWIYHGGRWKYYNPRFLETVRRDE